MSVTNYIQPSSAEVQPIVVIVDARGECFEFLDSLPESKKSLVTPLLIDCFNFDLPMQNQFEDSLVQILQENYREDFYSRPRIALVHEAIGQSDPTKTSFKEAIESASKVNLILSKYGFDVIQTRVSDEVCSLSFKKLVADLLK